MHQERHTKLFTAIAVGLAVAVMAPIGAAKAPPQVKVTIPDWLTRIQYPGTSSEATVYMPVQSSSRAPDLTVKNGHIQIPARLARTQYPGTSSEPTVLIVGTGPVGGEFDWVSALIGAAGGLGIAVAGAGSLMAARKRRTLTHV